MTIREDFNRNKAAFEEARAMYETAKAEFEELDRQIRETLSKGIPPTYEQLMAEDAARARLFLARVRLSRRAHGYRRRKDTPPGSSGSTGEGTA